MVVVVMAAIADVTAATASTAAAAVVVDVVKRAEGIVRRHQQPVADGQLGRGGGDLGTLRG